MFAIRGSAGHKDRDVTKPTWLIAHPFVSHGKGWPACGRHWRLLCASHAYIHAAELAGGPGIPPGYPACRDMAGPALKPHRRQKKRPATDQAAGPDVPYVVNRSLLAQFRFDLVERLGLAHAGQEGERHYGRHAEIGRQLRGRNDQIHAVQFRADLGGLALA